MNCSSNAFLAKYRSGKILSDFANRTTTEHDQLTAAILLSAEIKQEASSLFESIPNIHGTFNSTSSSIDVSAI